MRLIDAEKTKEVVKERLKDEDIVASSLVYWVISKVLDDQPTAYDVDNVIEELEHEKLGDYANDRFDRGFNGAIDMCIDIVKSGGITNE